MLVYLGFDDTDVLGAEMGTGRLVRTFLGTLSPEYAARGVLRHQHPRLEDIPYTSNNSSACAVIECPDGALDALTAMAAAYLVENASPGSDPGLCVLPEDAVDGDLIAFALRATGRRVTQAEAMGAMPGGFKDALSGHGGTNDGIIGAAAAVGLTRHGWCGRFIEYGGLRALGEGARVEELSRCGVRVVSVDRDPAAPLPEDVVYSGGWLRPSLLAGQPVLQVVADGPGVWRTAHSKRPKGARP